MTTALTPRRRPGTPARRSARRRPPLLLGAATLLVVLLALLGPLVPPHSPTAQLAAPFQRPDGAFPLGTDVLGRDVASRVLGGGRTIVLTALAGTAAAGAVGMTAGVLAAMVSRRLGDLLVRCVDALAVLPPLLVVLVLAAGFPGSGAAVVAAVALATAPFSTRVLRAAADTVLASGYVEAARARGDTRRAVLRHDVLPNIAGPALVDTALRLVASLHLTATAGFLGLGPGGAAPDWGRMVSENAPGATLAAAPFLAPALLLVLLSVCVGLLAGRLADTVGRGAA
ncbi:ABC transporter permease subunit [Streptomyces olivaceus]|uniref:ABC transporter permease subunit n=1 Tax=Streptomyces olivaceus TaxID=47716 RepID=A0ABS7VXW7_STROV|nr:ABC transporter permease subunit [Streptomyces olivaceus]MBZ6087713.1 ABC transporter permease subunit [Streptomyces olivaceus]MBZ6095451.1 ABC transporter permease subunit [Streptomyces olivaceus]MBZ6115851.1 ABC transporter permease subunit [Streptomyces olivaceus]MBZ6150557.1 ABC transporter permease subunit [Streptomyces olivaceus]MBZ6204386.1 ABC transporter permease subunit [Streptomyces olivaceus]